MGDLFIKDFPSDLHRALKIKAAEDGKSLKATLIELLQKQLKKENKK